MRRGEGGGYRGEVGRGEGVETGAGTIQKERERVGGGEKEWEYAREGRKRGSEVMRRDTGRVCWIGGESGG